jgi:hypothetical protein
MANQLSEILRGENNKSVPEGLITGLKSHAGGHIKAHSFSFVNTINTEIGRIETIKQRQAALFVTINSAITAFLFTLGMWAVENEYWPSWMPYVWDGSDGY